MAPAAVAYPIIFNISDVVPTCSFVTRVRACGRALMRKEQDGIWWIYGVEPGGLAECGDSPQTAYLRFVETFKGIISDLAGDTKGFDRFAQEVTRFFNEADETERASWEDALYQIRSGKVAIEPPFKSLTLLPSETPRVISVEMVRPDGFSAERKDTVALPFQAAA